jgi:hypothetical protein
MKLLPQPIRICASARQAVEEAEAEEVELDETQQRR